MTKTKDLGRAPLLPLVFSLAIPTMLAQFVSVLYSIVDRKVQEDVPMFSAYVISSLAAVNERLTGAEPTVYGFFNHVEQWDVQ